jgi:GLPGLI family protein
MKTFKILSLSLLLFLCSSVKAQFARFPANGVIEFEKRVNMFALIKKTLNKENESWMAPAFEEFKKTQPQFKVSKSTLHFSKDRTLFTPGENVEERRSFIDWHPLLTQFNTVYNDLSSQTSVIQKKLFDEAYLFKDTTRAIKWKLTDENREIAGYSCRRANAVIMDSIYVVAYYTDQIPVSSGPEVFAGLPGMILGVALPHDNVTWFATSVTDKPLEKPITAPIKGKASTPKTLNTILESIIKQHGEFLRKAVKYYFL